MSARTVSYIAQISGCHFCRRSAMQVHGEKTKSSLTHAASVHPTLIMPRIT